MLKYILAHSGDLSQFANVIQGIATKQSQVNLAFTHLHFQWPCFVRVYTSFNFAFYAAFFAESVFFMAQFYREAVSPGRLSEASSSIFVAVTFSLLGFCTSGTFGFAHIVCFTYLHYSAFIFVFCSTFCCNVFWGNNLTTYATTL